MRYRIDLAYDGAGFCGWQIQPRDPSVQEVLEKALSTLLKTKVNVTGAGRTDTGVNASHYVAHFDYDGAAVDGSPADCRQLRYKLNAILPRSVSILSVSGAAPGFHARFDAVLRQYTYYLHRAKDPFAERYSYFYAYPSVDFELMNKAALMLVGQHDFSCFEKSGGDNKTSVCTVSAAYWEPYTPEFCAARPAGQDAQMFWRFIIEADRFLRNMVRAVVGTLLEVGRGRRSLEEFEALVLPPGEAATDGAIPAKGPVRRSEAGESVPGNALFLSRIDYPRR